MIQGFAGDYTNILALSGNNGEAYNRPNNSVIIINSAVDTVKFSSPNYIQNVGYPSQIQAGQMLTIIVTPLAYGSTSVVINFGGSMLFTATQTGSNRLDISVECPHHYTP